MGLNKVAKKKKMKIGDEKFSVFFLLIPI